MLLRCNVFVHILLTPAITKRDDLNLNCAERFEDSVALLKNLPGSRRSYASNLALCQHAPTLQALHLLTSARALWTNNLVLRAATNNYRSLDRCFVCAPCCHVVCGLASLQAYLDDLLYHLIISSIL